MRQQIEKQRDFCGMRVMFALSLALFLSAPVLAFQSVKRNTVRATAIMGRGAAGNFKIQHTPLTKASPVTQQVIILGEAGSEVPPVPPPYESRLTPFSDFGPLPNRKVRIRVFYRYIPSLDLSEGAGIPLTELPLIEGPDPTAFAFEVTPSSVTTGFLQYRIVINNLLWNGTSLVEGGQTTFPPTTAADPQPFVTVGVQANASLVVGPEGGRFELVDGNPVDGMSAVDFPAGLFSAPTLVTGDEIPLSVSGLSGPAGQDLNPLIPPGLVNPVGVYRFSSETPLRGLIQLSLLYKDFEFPQGKDGIVDGTNIPVQKLSLLWWDGFAWRVLGGIVNTKNNTVSAKISALGFIAIAAAGAPTPAERRPMERVITPNGDGINDSAFFSFGALAEIVKVEIFDITGHRIKTIMSNVASSWDGRDDNGSVVESGVYIYQYEVEGKRISGLIAVAK